MKTVNRSTKATSSHSNPELLLDNQLCFALYSASLAMTKIYKPVLDAIGLTYPQYLVMLVLWERDGLTVSALGERLSLDSGTLTPLLKRMEVAGIVARKRSGEDERRVEVFVTDSGITLKAQATSVPRCVASQTGYAIPEILALTKEVQKLRASLKS